MGVDADADLLELAAAVADESPIDWERAGGGDDPRRAGLREVAALTAAFRAAGRELAAEADDATVVPGARWGHLEIGERLGGGSFGDVFRARDTVLERDVALKLWRCDDPRSGVGRRRFLREARLLARVRHPNVLTVHGADVHEGRAGIWTDLIEGQTLAEWVATNGTLGAEEASHVGVELCRALAAVHAASLVHGDVKLANVLRERGGRIVLADFGAGVEAGGDAAVPCGTPLTMAPEVLAGATPSPAADLYSLGVLLYHLVSGRDPIEPISIGALIAAHERGQRTPLADYRPDLPPAFVAAVERALAPRPEDRYASAGAMEQALAASLPENGRKGAAAVRWRRLALGGALAAAAAAAAWLGLAPARPSLPPGQVRQLAVLPFADAGADAEFVGAGLADGLARRLGGIPGLRVTPTEDVLRWIGGHPDAFEVGRLLGVPAFLDGTVTRSRERIELDLALVHAADGSTIWRTTAASPGGDLAAVEKEAARRVARALGLSGGGAENSLQQPAAVPPALAHALLAGRHFAAHRTPQGLERSAEALSRALALAPDSAVVNAALARTHALMAGSDPAPLPPSQAWVKARHHALRAIELDPRLAAGHIALAQVAFRCDWDWRAAERALRRALQLAPADAEAHQILAELLSVVGRHEEAIREAERAVELAPGSAAALTTSGAVLLEAGRFEQAADELARAIAADPTFHPAYTTLGDVLEERGNLDEAVAQWRNGLALSGAPPEEAPGLGLAFASSGMAGVWRWRLERLDERAQAGWASPALRARAWAGLGRAEEALAWLERAIDERDASLLRVKEEPAFDHLHSDERFAALLARLELAASVPDPDLDGRANALPPLSVEAALYRNREGRSESLGAGAAVRPGDRLFLAVTCAEPVHLYVLNEDRRGNLFVLFPLPEVELLNPLPARARHRLPGTRAGDEQDWVVTSAGGRETILVIAARARLPEVEREIVHLRAAAAGRPVEPEKPVGGTVVALRGVGGIDGAVPLAGLRPGGRLTTLAARLADAAARGEVWLKDFVLDNGGA